MLALSARSVFLQAKSALSTVQVHMVITNQAFTDNDDPPLLRPEDVRVKQGENALKVNQVTAARGDNASLSLFILIDDTFDPRIGTNLNAIRDFMNAQPASAQVGISYMSNATFKMAQNFSSDHALASKALRFPPRAPVSHGQPLFVLDLFVEELAQERVRREVLMLSDGIDRLHGNKVAKSRRCLA